VRRFFIALFTPLARHLRGVSPNVLTFVAVLASAAAGGAFALARGGRVYYAMAAVFLALSGAADSLDGITARTFQRTSAWGDFLDHFGDRLAEVCILSGIAFSPGANPTLGLYVLVMTLLHGYLGTQIEATFGARRYEGAGKTELFVALIAFAIVLAFFPAASLAVGSLSCSLPNAFLAGLGLATVAAAAARLQLASTLRHTDARDR
jgi:phosphatidylglycerophosphate synthase